MIVICFVFALKTGLGWKRRKETPVGFTGGQSKSKKLFKGKVPKPFWHSDHFGDAWITLRSFRIIKITWVALI